MRGVFLKFKLFWFFCIAFLFCGSACFSRLNGDAGAGQRKAVEKSNQEIRVARRQLRQSRHYDQSSAQCISRESPLPLRPLGACGRKEADQKRHVYCAVVNLGPMACEKIVDEIGADLDIKILNILKGPSCAAAVKTLLGDEYTEKDLLNDMAKGALADVSDGLWESEDPWSKVFGGVIKGGLLIQAVQDYEDCLSSFRPKCQRLTDGWTEEVRAIRQRDHNEYESCQNISVVAKRDIVSTQDLDLFSARKVVFMRPIFWAGASATVGSDSSPGTRFQLGSRFGILKLGLDVWQTPSIDVDGLSFDSLVNVGFYPEISYHFRPRWDLLIFGHIGGASGRVERDDAGFVKFSGTSSSLGAGLRFHYHASMAFVSTMGVQNWDGRASDELERFEVSSSRLFLSLGVEIGGVGYYGKRPGR